MRKDQMGPRDARDQLAVTYLYLSHVLVPQQHKWNSYEFFIFFNSPQAGIAWFMWMELVQYLNLSVRQRDCFEPFRVVVSWEPASGSA